MVPVPSLVPAPSSPPYSLAACGSVCSQSSVHAKPPQLHHVSLIGAALGGAQLRTLRQRRARGNVAVRAKGNEVDVTRRRVLAAAAGSALIRSDAALAEEPSTVEVYKVKGLDVERIAPANRLHDLLAKNDIVLLGEHHDSAADHSLHLMVIETLQQNRGSRPLSVGMEMVQKRFQPVLDDYVAGRLDDQQLFQGTEWATRWTWPFELSVPIFRYCKEKGIKLVALNTDSETLAKVERGGLEELQAQDWARLVPDRRGFGEMGKDPAFKAYLSRVVIPSYYLHQRLGILQQTVTGQVLDEPMTLKHFVSGRLLWDETMATSAIQHVNSQAGQGGLMCVLVGGDHVKYRYGLRARMERLARSLSKDSMTKELQILSVMLNPGQGDELAKDGPIEVTAADGTKTLVPFADLVLVSQAAGPAAVPV